MRRKTVIPIYVETKTKKQQKKENMQMENVSQSFQIP